MTAHSDVVLSGPDRPLVPAAPPDAASVAAPLLDALGQFRHQAFRELRQRARANAGRRTRAGTVQRAMP
jgi:hypothetical protein